MKTLLANDIESAENKRKYDAQCKKVLSNKYIPANILKHTIEEVKENSIEEIISYMDGDIDIGNLGILEGTDKERISLENSEDVSVKESIIYYDIRFSICLENQKKIKILFDLEAQKKYNPGYHIVTRGIVYGARMISSQIGTEFDLTHYDDVKKVYSVWICFVSSKKIGNAISRYAIKKEDIIPGIPDCKQAYDKLSIIEICLNENEESKHFLINMLNTLFSDTKSSEDIQKELEIEYHIPMSQEYKKEVELMCNLSGRVEEYGIIKGIEKGKIQMLCDLITEGILTISDAAIRMLMSEEDFITLAKREGYMK